MIPAKELRIGNWFEKHGELFEITSITESHMLFSRDNAYKQKVHALDRCNGIPLTLEVFTRCGFSNCKLYSFGKEYEGYRNEFLSVIAYDDGLYVYFEVEDDPFHSTRFGRQIKYLHQLQNLFFDLTGVELEFE